VGRGRRESGVLMSKDRGKVYPRRGRKEERKKESKQYTFTLFLFHLGPLPEGMVWTHLEDVSFLLSPLRLTSISSETLSWMHPIMLYQSSLLSQVDT
jgi:hypothetical protein